MTDSTGNTTKKKRFVSGATSAKKWFLKIGDPLYPPKIVSYAREYQWGTPVLEENPLSCTSVTSDAKFERRSHKMGEVQRRLFWEPFLLPPSLPAIQHFCSALEAISRKPRDHSCMLTLCTQAIEQDGKHQMKPSMISASLDSLDSLAFLLALEAVMSQKKKPNSKGGRKPSD